MINLKNIGLKYGRNSNSKISNKILMKPRSKIRNDVILNESLNLGNNLIVFNLMNENQFQISNQKRFFSNIIDKQKETVVEKTQTQSEQKPKLPKKTSKPKANMADFLKQMENFTSNTSESKSENNNSENNSKNESKMNVSKPSSAMEKNYYRKPLDWHTEDFYDEKSLEKVCCLCEVQKKKKIQQSHILC